MYLARLHSRATRVPKTAMILAAGLGKRMMPLSDRIPKPLLVIAGKTLLDRALERLIAAGVERIVVNASHLADRIVDHVTKLEDNRVFVSIEDEPLETGGGVVNAIDLLGQDPFYLINGDSVWVDGMKCTLLRLAETWDADRMDALLLLASLPRVPGFSGLGDFVMDQDGLLDRRPEAMVAPYAYMGLSILSAAMFEGAPNGPFSLNKLYNGAIEARRLHGMLHDGLWYHVSTPEDLEIARNRFATGHAPAVALF
ncbi:MAG: mannose-1-phosphate guanylyltransferase [Rhodospirillaceae bacterium]|nr:mannose-1-phosphate guanylyltransferase [Rhodospirillaceae bacterium]